MRPVAGLAVFLLAMPPAVGGAAPDTLRVAATVNPSVVRIGERVTLEVRVPNPGPGARLLGVPAPGTAGSIDVLVSEPLDLGPDSLGWRMEVAFFDVGEADVSRIPFTLQREAGDVPVQLAPYTVSIVSSLPESLAMAAPGGGGGTTETAHSRHP